MYYVYIYQKYPSQTDRKRQGSSKKKKKEEEEAGAARDKI
jgi:hypothetical protein